MNIRKTTLALAAFAALSLSAQDSPHILGILNEVESNNLTLAALRAGNEAMRLDNLTGLNLEDPEVSFSYMWGHGDIDKTKLNLEVTQGFDFATLSGAKRRLAKSKNTLLELEYRQAALDVELQARKCIVNLTYYNALVDLYTTRLAEYAAVHSLAQQALERGDMTMMDMNAITLHKYNLECDLRLAEIERESAQNELDLLNGGKRVEYTESKYCPDYLPADFDTWYATAFANNPAMSAFVQQLQVDKNAVSLAKAESLPGFSVGYTNEFIPGGNLNGFVVGLTLPLWNNAGKVKAAKAAMTATEAQYYEASQRFVNDLHTQYNRTAQLNRLADQYEEMVQLSDNKEFLDKALAAGQMTVIEYVSETDAFTDMKVKALDAWKEYHQSLADLLIYTR